MAARARVRAPELVGKGGWLNTGGKDLTLADLRGRIAILDFWTFCCVNCLHVLDELRELEERHRDTVVIVGRALAEVRARGGAPGRRGRRRAVRGAPPGARRPGAGHLEAVRRTGLAHARRDRPRGLRRRPARGRGPRARASRRSSRSWRREHAAKGTLRRGDGPYVPPEPVATDLRFPGKALRLPDGGHFLVSDTTRHQLVELAADGESVRAPDRHRRARPGRRRRGHGAVQRAAGPGAAARRRTVRSSRTRSTTRCAAGPRRPAGRRTLAGTGEQWWQGSPTSGPAREVALSSPWDVAWFDGPAVDRDGGRAPAVDVRPGCAGPVGVAAGHDQRGPGRRPAAEAWFAQPSGLPPRRTAGGCGSPTRRRRRVRWIERRTTPTATASSSAPPSAPGSSTSGTATAPPDRRCSSTRWASPRCPTARSPSATPTTTRCAATTRTTGEVTHARDGSARAVGRGASVRRTTSWSWSRPGTG